MARTGSANPAYVHGHNCRGSRSPEYRAWSNMIQRCTNPDATYYKNYGGRGITVCERWLVFDAFLSDMGLRPAGTSIDRGDNSKGYSPGNCRWIGRQEQSRNTRANRLVTIGSETRCLIEWCEVYKLDYSTVFWRIKHHNCSYAEALTAPKIKGRRAKCETFRTSLNVT